MSDLITDMMHQATHDAALFRTYADDYDIVDDDQIMRCLANLDDAIKGLQFLYSFASNSCNEISDAKKIETSLYRVYAITTPLSIMQKNLQKAVEHEAEKVLESKREMAAIGGDRG